MSHKIPIRILMAVWILSCFVVTQLYASQLYGYLMANIPLPIVDSGEELVDKPGVDLVVVNARAPYLTITVYDHYNTTYLNSFSYFEDVKGNILIIETGIRISFNEKIGKKIE